MSLRMGDGIPKIYTARLLKDRQNVVHVDPTHSIVPTPTGETRWARYGNIAIQPLLHPRVLIDGLSCGNADDVLLLLQHCSFPLSTTSYLH
jgi:hypothetical protein